MYESLRSVLTGTIGLSVAAAAALLLTVVRKPLDHGNDQNTIDRERTLRLFLIGLAAQSLHFMEEFVARFQDRFPALLGLEPWSANFFVIFNSSWLCVWILSAIGLRKGYRVAFFPVWFFAIAAIANGIVHPILAISARGYFPGLITSPLVGVAGVLLFLRLLATTSAAS
jgi:hypothetical protein